MLEVIPAVLAGLRSLLASRASLMLENLALRQQVAVLKRKRPQPRLSAGDRLFWLTLRKIWSRWATALVIVKPATVVGWHRSGFRLYWRWRSRRRIGRPKVSAEVRQLILRLARENTNWGAPRIHGELYKLGLDVSERTVVRYLRTARRRGPNDNWLTFLNNHREAIAAFDFFTVPTVAFRLLYGFFVIDHSRRKILHWNVTSHPDSAWVAQQLREAFPDSGPRRYVLFDHDSKFDDGVVELLKSSGLSPKRTGIQSPWQNGTAERWVGSARREVLDHVIPLNEAHLRRLLKEYVAYYHEDRIHDSLGKDTPTGRPIEARPSLTANLTARPRIGGLHHRYSWAPAA